MATLSAMYFWSLPPVPGNWSERHSEGVPAVLDGWQAMPSAGTGTNGRKMSSVGEDREFAVNSIEDIKSEIQIKHVRKGPKGGAFVSQHCAL